VARHDFRLRGRDVWKAPLQGARDPFVDLAPAREELRLMNSGTPSDLATITSRASGGSPVAAATAPASSADAAGDRLARFTTVTFG